MTQATANTRHRCQHRQYQMTCEEFDLLYERSGGRCEMCNKPEEEATRGVLFIDHDNRYGFGAVRGLVCSHCNQYLRWVESGVHPMTDQVRRYFNRAWFLELDQIRKGKDPLYCQPHENTAIWNAFGRAAGTDRWTLLRRFVEWYVRTPGVTLPKRPERRPIAR